jgi:hypothetical protein
VTVPAVVERARPIGLPRAIALGCAVLVAIGVVALVAGLATDAATAWRAFHVNYLFYAGLAHGGVVLAAIFVIVGAHWPGPIRHVAAALGAWLPVSLLLFGLGFLGRHNLYPWIETPVPSKAAWLNEARLFATDLGILLALTGLSIAFLYYTMRPALHGAAEGATGPARALLVRWTSGWRGHDLERERCARALRRIAPALCLVYAFGFTVIGFDQVMSLSPTWFSNLFGAYFAWGAFLSAVCATALISVLLRRQSAFAGEITPLRMHDLGKMVFAFSIFWMYLFWSQYLVIWYGNLPEETGFLQARLGTQFLVDKSGINQSFLVETWGLGLLRDRLREPYAKVSLAVWACCWIVPFWMLLGQRPKKTPWILGPVALVVLIGFWLERNVLVWPSLVPEDSWAWLGAIQLGIAAGFLGAFVAVYLLFSRVVPSLPLPQRP